MDRIKRRDFLRRSALAAGLAAAGRAAASGAGEAKPQRIRVGQIGTAHAHAGGKMEALRRLVDDPGELARVFRQANRPTVLLRVRHPDRNLRIVQCDVSGGVCRQIDAGQELVRLQPTADTMTVELTFSQTARQP